MSLSRVRWSSEEIAIVKKYWMKGESTREISNRLPGRTRAGVIGIINRLRESKNYAPLSEDVKQYKLPKPSSLRFKKIKAAPKSHPLMRDLIDLMNEHQCSIETLCNKVGMSRTTFQHWRFKHVPSLEIIEACFNYFDRTLRPVPMKREDDEG